MNGALSEVQTLLGLFAPSLLITIPSRIVQISPKGLSKPLHLGTFPILIGKLKFTWLALTIDIVILQSPTTEPLICLSEVLEPQSTVISPSVVASAN